MELLPVAAVAAEAAEACDDLDSGRSSPLPSASPSGLRRPQPSTDTGAGQELPPTTDPCAFICEELLVSPKIGHSYVVYTFGQRRQAIVGPHWAGMLYTASLITGSTVAFISNT